MEPVFVLYRVTGDTTLLEKAWVMFEAIQQHTKIAFETRLWMMSR